MTQYSGFPASGKFIDTKTNVEALGLVAGNEGALAYATDTDLLGWWDGSTWHWLYDLNGSDHTLILDTDGDTHIAAPTDDQIDFTVASARQVHISDGIFWPNMDNDIDLGSATYEFKDLYIDGTAYLDTIMSDIITIDGAAASYRFLNYTTSGSLRWRAAVDSTAESGGNVGSDYVIIRYNDAGASLGPALEIYRSTGYVNVTDRLGIGLASPAAKLHVDQSAAAGAIPALTLDQADVDQVMMKFIGTAGAAAVDRTLAAASDWGTPGALAGWIQIEIDDVGNRITDGDYYMPFYAAPS